MRDPATVERYRMTDGPIASDASCGMNGAFLIPYDRVTLRVVASDGMGWEHVSVSLSNRCPTWEEMDCVKNIFWREDETVMQLHVPKSDHINCHKFCLHMWRPKGVEIPRPPQIMIGPE